MKQFTFSDVNRASGEILEAALVEPVTLTKRGKEKLVILSATESASWLAVRVSRPTRWRAHRTRLMKNS